MLALFELLTAATLKKTHRMIDHTHSCSNQEEIENAFAHDRRSVG